MMLYRFHIISNIAHGHTIAHTPMITHAHISALPLFYTFLDISSRPRYSEEF